MQYLETESCGLKDEVEAKLGDLLKELGIRLTHATYEPESFGDSTLKLDFGSFVLNLTRDRGDTWVEVASKSKPGESWDIDIVSDCLIGRAFPITNIIQLGEFIRNHYRDLSLLFRDDFRRLRPLLNKKQRDREDETKREIEGWFKKAERETGGS